jgi:BioD-like phosphotransacetylase family protein
VVPLYITSLSNNSGKTLLSAGLGKTLIACGNKVGYIKPVMDVDEAGESNSQKDAVFLKHVLALKESVEEISPVIKNAEDIVAVVEQAYTRAARGRDIVIIEGFPLKDSGPVIEALNAGVLIVHDYSEKLAESIAEYKISVKHFTGIIVNKVPVRRLEAARSETANLISSSGPLVLGLIPEDRIFMSLTIAELAEMLRGKILNNTEKASDLIENFMLGAMTFDSGIEYFARKNNKAVILNGNRPDMQMAALQTSTRCIVLSEEFQPLPVVARQAALKKIPVISAPGDVPFLISVIEKTVAGNKFNQDKKILSLMGVIQKNINLNQLIQNLGLAG